MVHQERSFGGDYSYHRPCPTSYVSYCSLSRIRIKNDLDPRLLPSPFDVFSIHRMAGHREERARETQTPTKLQVLLLLLWAGPTAVLKGQTLIFHCIEGVLMGFASPSSALLLVDNRAQQSTCYVKEGGLRCRTARLTRFTETVQPDSNPR